MTSLDGRSLPTSLSERGSWPQVPGIAQGRSCHGAHRARCALFGPSAYEVHAKIDFRWNFVPGRWFDAQVDPEQWDPLVEF